MTAHPYLNGYNTLPALSKVTEPYFEDVNRKDEKLKALESQNCLLEHNMTPEIYEAVCQFILQNHPLQLTNHPLEAPYTFPNLALQIQEDLAIHRLQDGKDWLAATHICFPSNWWPEEKIGKTFQEIHEPVPGMNLKNSRKLVETSIFKGPFQRYVWGLVYEPASNGHPSIPKKSFSLEKPEFYVKVETQMMVGFPEQSCLLFILRQKLLSATEINQPALLSALKQMTPAQKEYKGITEELIAYLT